MTLEEYAKLQEMYNQLTPENKEKADALVKELLRKQGGKCMRIQDLNREQLMQVKQNYYTQKQAEKGAGVSYGELATINELITDAEIYAAYEGVEFVPDDFT